MGFRRRRILVSESEKFRVQPEGYETVYIIRRIPPKEKARLRDLTQFSVVIMGGTLEKRYSENNKYFMEIIKYGLINWENMMDIHGKEIPFNKSLIDYLPPEDTALLVDKISGTTKVREVEELEIYDKIEREQFKKKLADKDHPEMKEIEKTMEEHDENEEVDPEPEKKL